MARPCTQCDSKLHDTKVHKFWQAYNKPHKDCIPSADVAARWRAFARFYRDFMDKETSIETRSALFGVARRADREADEISGRPLEDDHHGE